MPRGEEYLIGVGVEIEDDASKSADRIAKSVTGMSNQLTQGLATSRGFQGALGALAGTMRMGALAATGLGGPLGIVAGVLGSLGAAATDLAGRLVGQLSNAFRAVVGLAKNLVSQLAAVGQKILTIGKWATLAAAVGLEEFARRSIKVFASFEQAVTNAVAVMGLGGAAATRTIKQMSGAIIDMSRRSAKLPQEIAEGLYGVASAGLQGAKALNVLAGVLALAEANQADMAVTTELIVAALKGFQRPMADATKIANMFSAAISNSMLKVERLSVSLPIVGAIAHGFGLSIGQAVTALAKLQDAGLEASTTGTGLRMMLIQLSNVSDRGRLVLRKYGLAVADVSVEQRGWLPVIRTLNRAQMKMSDIAALVGARAAVAFKVLATTGAKGLKTFEKSITGTTRAFEMQKLMLSTLEGQWNIFKSTFQALQTDFAEGMAPALKNFVGLMEDLTNELRKTGVMQKFGAMLGGMLTSATQKALVFVKSVDWEAVLKRVRERLLAFGETAKNVFNWVREAVTTHGPTVVAWFKALPGHIANVRNWLADNIPKAVVAMSDAFTKGAIIALDAIGLIMPKLLTLESVFYAVAISAHTGASAIMAIAGILGMVSDETVESWRKIPKALTQAHLGLTKAGLGFMVERPAIQHQLRGRQAQTQSWARTLNLNLGGSPDMMDALRRDPDAYGKFLAVLREALVAVDARPAGP